MPNEFAPPPLLNLRSSKICAAILRHLEDSDRKPQETGIRYYPPMVQNRFENFPKGSAPNPEGWPLLRLVAYSQANRAEIESALSDAGLSEAVLRPTPYVFPPQAEVLFTDTTRGEPQPKIIPAHQFLQDEPHTLYVNLAYFKEHPAPMVDLMKAIAEGDRVKGKPNQKPPR